MAKKQKQNKTKKRGDALLKKVVGGKGTTDYTVKPSRLDKGGRTFTSTADTSTADTSTTVSTTDTSSTDPYGSV